MKKSVLGVLGEVVGIIIGFTQADSWLHKLALFLALLMVVAAAFFHFWTEKKGDDVRPAVRKTSDIVFVLVIVLCVTAIVFAVIPSDGPSEGTEKGSTIVIGEPGDWEFYQFGDITFIYQIPKKIACELSVPEETGAPSVEENTPSNPAVSPVIIPDYIEFGSYRQGADGSRKPIRWKVIDHEGSRALLVSEQGLDVCLFNLEQTAVTWADSSIREWLNGEFFRTAFKENTDLILISDVPAHLNPKYPEVDAGPATKDRIFLLSVEEISRYMKTDEARQLSRTDYAAENYEGGIDTNCDGNYCWWWTRTPGKDSHLIADVKSDGTFNSDGIVCDWGNVTVRPAMWVDLSGYLSD